ncbi:MAG: hypothetical protein KF805_11555 [Phycisphaeraceae bacterium]|nr:hypothetical protein [Phycisphaeraceae bacterium]
MPRKTRKVVGCFGAVAAGFALAGCGAGRFVPEKSPNAWTGPAIWIESSPQWTVVVNPPIGGWRVKLNQIMEQRGRTEVFISLLPPNPSFIVSPTPVEQRNATTISSTIPLWVYARQLNWQGEPPDGPFSLAAKSDDAKPPPSFEDVPPTRE